MVNIFDSSQSSQDDEWKLKVGDHHGSSFFILSVLPLRWSKLCHRHEDHEDHEVWKLSLETIPKQNHCYPCRPHDFVGPSDMFTKKQSYVLRPPHVAFACRVHSNKIQSQALTPKNDGKAFPGWYKNYTKVIYIYIYIPHICMLSILGVLTL